jgi:alkylation response protein AidB-like acyl-CoA dehydrogenase
VPAIRGEQVAAIAVTEPSAGSDVANIKTRAVRDGDDWVINGSKMYITNAATADWLCLLAVTDPDAGYGGYTQIIVPTDSPGFTYQLLDKIGNKGSDTGLLFFSGKPKALYDAFRMPVYLPVTTASGGHSLEVWGCVRPAHYAMQHASAPQVAQVQFKPAAE